MSASEVAIMPAETPIRFVDFHPNLILRHLTQSIVVTDKRVVVRVPRTILVFFVLGYLEKSVTWDNVDTVVSGRWVNARRLAMGVLLLMFIVFQMFGSVAMFSMAGMSGGDFGDFGVMGVFSAVLVLALAALAVYLIYSAFERVVGVVSSAETNLLVRVGGNEAAEMDAVAGLLKVISTQRTEPTRAPA